MNLTNLEKNVAAEALTPAAKTPNKEGFTMTTNCTENAYELPDVNVAEQFLTLLDEDNDQFTFVAIEEPKPCDRNPKIRLYHGTLCQHQEALIKANRAGYGVFVTVNATDGQGRSKANVRYVRALFTDLDGNPLDPIYSAPLDAHIIIQTSDKRFHAYWLVKDVPLKDFEFAQRFLAKKFGGDPSVCDLPRLMRLPGFMHLKQKPFRSHILEWTGTRKYSYQEFQEAFQWRPVIEDGAEASSHVQGSHVLDLLRDRGLLKQEEDHVVGRWRIRCPWSYEHTNGCDDAYYFAKPSKEFPYGGFKCFHGHCEYQDLRALRVYLGLTPVEGVESLPLFREVSPPAPYPAEALGPILGQAALELHETIQAPMAVIAQSLLGVASLVTQGHANIETADGRSIALSLFLITVAESGERKSAVDDVGLSAVLEYQAMLARAYKEEKFKYELELEAWNESKKKARGSEDSSVLFECDPEPEHPVLPTIVVEEPTYEGLVKYLEYGQPSVGVFSDEGGRFLGGNAMSRENKLKTLAGLSSLWDAKKDKPITRMRSGDKSLALYGRRCALHFMIQESVYGELTEQSICETQGFLPRCLVTFPESMAGTRMYKEGNPRELLGVRTFYKQCNSLIDQPFPSAPPPAPKNQLEVRSITLSREAHLCYIKHHNSWEAKLGKGGELYNIRRFGSKAAEHMLRIAGVLALFESPNAVEVSEEYIERAATIVDYYLKEQLRLDSYYSVDPKLLTAQKVLNWVQAKGKVGARLRDIYQYGPSEVRSKNKASEIMKILEKHGRAFPVSPIEIGEEGTGKAWRFVGPES